MDNYVKGVKVIEIYDAANKELLVKYDDKHNIDKVISALCKKKSKNRIIRINTGILSNMKQKIKEFYH